MPPTQSTDTIRGFDAPPRRAPWWWLLFICVFGGFSLVLFWAPLRSLLPFTTYPLGFDAMAILAALDANRLGLDVTVANPLDTFNRPHVYSSWWLYLQHLGLGRANLLGFYLTSLGFFLLPALLQFRPRTVRGGIWLFSFFVSVPVLLALHRGNNDLVVFGLLSFVVPCLLSRSAIVRLLAPLLIVFATGLKYYPLIALLLVFVPDSPRVRFRLLVFAGVLLVLLVGSFSQDFTVVSHLRVVNDAQGFLGVGASLLFSGFSVPTPLQKLFAAGLGLFVAASAWRLKGTAPWVRVVSSAPSYGWFLLGAAVYAGSYWLIANWAYRLIFLVWLLPFLLEPPAEALMPGWLRVSTRWIRWFILFLFWAPLLVVFVLACLGEPVTGPCGRSLSWLLQLGYAVLAVYCTLLVADLVYVRLRSWLGWSDPAAT